MNTENLKETVVRAAELLDLFKRRSEETGRANRDNAARLQRVVEEAPQQIRKAADDALGRVSGDVAQAVKGGLGNSLNEFQRAAGDSRKQVDAAGQGFAQLARQAATLEKRLLMVTTAVGLVLLLALAIGSVGLWYLQREVARNQVELELLRAYNRADVTLCHDGRLCARLEPGSANDGKEYRLVAPRR
ncbi:hypothetical protein [Marilutibacter alkalisoli]|uniref:Relaxation protein n=1 Tax=Marilutibacter alkalisoli TaxID=2591633 RepID=A0A514BPF2_9GAMM|nr:hypothetical protein [Lysobacter alkalisoli]QDH69253.1 hypothetical protein FKV23_03420 [Lysobacter alkalisoli]